MSSANDREDYPVFKGPGLYNIINSGAGTYLDLAESDPAPGAKIVGYPDTGNDNQKWEIADVGNNEYIIINKQTGTYVQANANHTPAVAAVGNPDDSKVHWRISFPEAGNPQVIQFQSVAVQGSALDLDGKSSDPGTPVQIWDQNTTTAQTWYLKPTS